MNCCPKWIAVLMHKTVLLFSLTATKYRQNITYLSPFEQQQISRYQ